LNIPIAVNTILEYIDRETGSSRFERVLWIQETKERIAVINMFEVNALPFFRELEDVQNLASKGMVSKLAEDPFFNLSKVDPNYIAKHAEKRDYAWQIIKDLIEEEPDIYIPESRGILFREVQAKFNVHKMTIFKYLRRYWIGGKTKNALLPIYYNCGAPNQNRKAGTLKRGRPTLRSRVDSNCTGINVDENMQVKFKTGIELFYNNADRLSLTKVHDLTMQRFFNLGYKEENGVLVPIMPPKSKLATYEQFYYYFRKNQNLTKSYIKREGEIQFQLTHRAVLGNATKLATGPGSVYQIDATIADIYLVSSYLRNVIIGRPIIYMIVDVFSRMITGMYIGLEGPSWIGAMMALANTTMDKVQFCREYGIEITEKDWPCKDLPVSIIGDRGEIEGYNADYLVDTLGIEVSTTPPYRADWKPFIEQNFRRANINVIHWLPGAVKDRRRKRGEPDHRLDATMDINEFTRIMIKYVLFINNSQEIVKYPKDEFMYREYVDPIPTRLWEWGMENKSGFLRESTPYKIKTALMPHGVATVTEEGIRFNGMYYSCPIATGGQWFVEARNRGKWQVDIIYDPRKTDVIYLISKDKNKIEACELLDETFKNRRLEEVLDLMALEKIRSKESQEKLPQAKAALQAEISAITKEAEKKTKLARESSNLSKTKLLNNIRPNRLHDKGLIRQNEACDLRDKPKQEGRLIALPTTEENSDQDVELLVKRKKSRYSEIIRNQDSENNHE
jgi:putative transposase